MTPPTRAVASEPQQVSPKTKPKHNSIFLKGTPGLTCAPVPTPGPALDMGLSAGSEHRILGPSTAWRGPCTPHPSSMSSTQHNSTVTSQVSARTPQPPHSSSPPTVRGHQRRLRGLHGLHLVSRAGSEQNAAGKGLVVDPWALSTGCIVKAPLGDLGTLHLTPRHLTVHTSNHQPDSGREAGPQRQVTTHIQSPACHGKRVSP